MFISRQASKKTHIQNYHGVNLVVNDPHSPINGEQYRALRTNIEFAQLNQILKSLLITSSVPSEGKSTISANLALVLAQTKQKVLLVDADLRKPTLHKSFRLNNQVGLTTLLMTATSDYSAVIQELPQYGLAILPTGPLPPNPSELLGSPKMALLIEDLESYFDIIIYDAPPIIAVTDAIILASKVDSVLLVARYGRAKRDEIRKAKAALMTVDASVLGYVMNDFPRPKAEKYYTYYGSTD